MTSSNRAIDQPPLEDVLSPERLAAVRRSGMLGVEAGRRFAQLTNLVSSLIAVVWWVHDD